MKTVFLTIALLISSIIGFAQAAPYVHVTEEEQSLVDQLAENPTDLKSNFNLATYYYNNAVTLISAQADGSMPGVEGIDAEIIRLLNAALNPALNAYEMDNKNEKVLEMLSGIYFGIGEMDAKEKIDKKLAKLRK